MPYSRYGGGPQDNRGQGQNVSHAYFFANYCTQHFSTLFKMDAMPTFQINNLCRQTMMNVKIGFLKKFCETNFFVTNLTVN